jgi:hypothetical protein
MTVPGGDWWRIRRNARVSLRSPLEGPFAFARCVRYQAADVKQAGYVRSALFGAMGWRRMRRPKGQAGTRERYARKRTRRLKARGAVKTRWPLIPATTQTNLVDPECFLHTAVTKEWRDPFAARRHHPCLARSAVHIRADDR